MGYKIGKKGWSSQIMKLGAQHTQAAKGRSYQKASAKLMVTPYSEWKVYRIEADRLVRSINRAQHMPRASITVRTSSRWPKLPRCFAAIPTTDRGQARYRITHHPVTDGPVPSLEAESVPASKAVREAEGDVPHCAGDAGKVIESIRGGGDPW